MEKSILQSKSFDLAVAVYQKVADLQKKQKEFLLSQQWADSVATVALHMYLAQELRSKNSLSINLYTARKATLKGLFWTNLLLNMEYLSSDTAKEVTQGLTELLKMLQASINTLSHKRQGSEEGRTLEEVSESD